MKYKIVGNEHAVGDFIPTSGRNANIQQHYDLYRLHTEIQFIQVLLEANGLAAGKDHQFKGRYDAEKNAVIISLETDEQSALSPQKCTT